MVFQTLFKSLSSKRGDTGDFFQLMSLLITITSGGDDGYYASPGNCDLVVGSGRDNIAFEATTLEYPLSLTTLSSSMIQHSGNNLIEVTATLKNNSNLDATVNEIGVSYRGRLLSRDVLRTGVTLAPGASHTFKAYLKIADNTYDYFNNLYTLLKNGSMKTINGETRSMSSISRKSDIAPIGVYDMWGSNESRWTYGGSRCWWVDVGFGDTPLSSTDINLADGNYARQTAGRSDRLTSRGQTNLSLSDPSYLVMEKASANFENATGSTLIIKEKGLFFGSGYEDSYRKYMMTREVLDEPIMVLPGETVTVECAIEFAI